MPDDFRRNPAFYRKISEISDTDARVSIIGTVLESSDGELEVDDGTGTITVTGVEENFDTGTLVRVIGRPADGFLMAEVVQDFSGFDLELFEKSEKVLMELLGSS